MYQYKTKDGSDILIPGVGATVNGEITSTRIIENPNLELVHTDKKSTEQPPAEEAVPLQPEVAEAESATHNKAEDKE